MPTAKVLVVDDEPDIRTLIKEILEEENYSVITAANGAEAREARRVQPPDLILLDIWMPDIDGISLLREWFHRGGSSCPVIMMSGHGTVETAVEATRLGAYDFVEKPISLAKLLIMIERALESNRLKQENAGLRRQLSFPLEPIGSSKGMTLLRAQLDKLIHSDASLLIQGESGTGKETLARYLHEKNARREGAFVSVSSGTIAYDYTAQALFGTEEGAVIAPGLLEQANGGTLFLDEVADLGPELQLRLSSALERRSLLRIGGSESIDLNLRVISATAENLEKLVKAGHFREELYYQLNVIPLNVPPLRDHLEDIPELLKFYADFFSTRDKLPYRHFPVSVQNQLKNYSWPGNQRELRNLVQRLLILGSTNEVSPSEIDTLLSHTRTPDINFEKFGIDLGLPLREAREQFERNYLLYQLNEANGSVGRLAKMAGMERTHLYRKLKDLGVDIKNREE